MPTLILKPHLYNRRVMIRMNDSKNDGAGIRSLFSFRIKILGAIVVFALGLCSSRAGVLESPRGTEVFRGKRPKQLQARTIRILWSYAVSRQTPDLVFKVYHSTDLGVAMENWPLLTNVPGSVRSVTLPASQPREFFILT